MNNSVYILGVGIIIGLLLMYAVGNLFGEQGELAMVIVSVGVLILGTLKVIDGHQKS